MPDLIKQMRWTMRVDVDVLRVRVPETMISNALGEVDETRSSLPAEAIAQS